MKKQEIDYSELSQERIITIGDLVREIIRKLWLVVVAAIVFALIFGGYKYAKDSKSAASSASSDASDMKVELSEKEQKEVNNVLTIQDNMNQQQEYVDNSVLVQIDPFNESKVTLQYHFDTDYTPSSSNDPEDYSSDLLNAYMGYVNNGALSSDLVNAGEDLDVQYIGELLNCTSDTDNKNSTSDSSNSITLNAATNSFDITVIYSNEEDCRELASKIVKCVEDYQKSLNKSVGAHTLTLVDQSYARVVDKSLITYKYDRTNSIVSMRDRVKELSEKLTAQQQSVVDKYSKESTDKAKASADDKKDTQNTTPSVSISKKYVGLGGIAGIILACLYIIIAYVSRGTINKAEDIQYLYNVRIAGTMKGKGKKKFTDKLELNPGSGAKLSPEAEQKLLLANLKVSCEKEQIQKLMITGTAVAHLDAAEKQQLVDGLKAAGVEVYVADSLLTSAEAIEKLAEYSHVLFVEQTHTSKYQNIAAELKICMEQKINVLGVVVLK